SGRPGSTADAHREPVARRHAMKVSPSLAAVVVAGIVAASVVADEPEKIGQVRFAVSCRADVQKPFERAVALLHSFRDIEAAKAFTAVYQVDPDSATVYWCTSMCIRTPTR